MDFLTLSLSPFPQRTETIFLDFPGSITALHLSESLANSPSNFAFQVRVAKSSNQFSLGPTICPHTRANFESSFFHHYIRTVLGLSWSWKPSWPKNPKILFRIFLSVLTNTRCFRIKDTLHIRLDQILWVLAIKPGSPWPLFVGTTI